METEIERLRRESQEKSERWARDGSTIEEQAEEILRLKSQLADIEQDLNAFTALEADIPTSIDTIWEIRSELEFTISDLRQELAESSTQKEPSHPARGAEENCPTCSSLTDLLKVAEELLSRAESVVPRTQEGIIYLIACDHVLTQIKGEVKP